MKLHKNVPLVILFLLVCPICLTAQQKEKTKILGILKKCMEKYESLESYEIKSEYTSYSTYSSNKIEEQYKGVFVKNGNLIYTKIGGIEQAILKGYTIAIDNETKLMNCKNNDPNLKKLEFFDVNKYTSHFDEFVLEEDSTYWICTLKTNSPIIFIPYTKVKLKINKKNYLLKEQILYLTTTAPYTDSKGIKKNDFPRIHIKFTETKETVPTIIDKLRFETYFKIVNKKFIPNGIYKTYKLTNN